jgi:hypothetical protein
MAKRRRQPRDAAAAEGLSSLPDDLLRRILFFAPAREAASTCVLSRRWRTSGAVNLDSRSYRPDPQAAADAVDDAGRLTRRRFLRGAEAALAVAHGPVTRLTVHLEGASSKQERGAVAALLNRRRFRALLRHPTAGLVEELRLRVAVVPAGDGPGPPQRGLYRLSFRKLPCEALRVLHVTSFTDLEPPPRSGRAAPAGVRRHLQPSPAHRRRISAARHTAP